MPGFFGRIRRRIVPLASDLLRRPDAIGLGEGVHWLYRDAGLRRDEARPGDPERPIPSVISIDAK